MSIYWQTFLDRIRGEYVEMPDLKLTNWQACRLWNLDAYLCDDILTALVEEGFLTRTDDGAYLRRDTGRRRGWASIRPLDAGHAASRTALRAP